MEVMGDVARGKGERGKESVPAGKEGGVSSGRISFMNRKSGRFQTGCVFYVKLLSQKDGSR